MAVNHLGTLGHPSQPSFRTTVQRWSWFWKKSFRNQKLEFSAKIPWVFRRFLPNDLDRKMKACIASKATTLRLECLSYSFKGRVAASMYRPSSSNEMNSVSFMLFQKVSHMVYQQWTHSNFICKDHHYIAKAMFEISNLVGAVCYRKLQAAHWFFGFALGVRQVIMRHYSGWTLCRRPKGATGPAHWDVLRDSLWSSAWKCLIQNVHNLRINTYLWTHSSNLQLFIVVHSYRPKLIV